MTFQLVEQPESALHFQEIFSVVMTPPEPFSTQAESSPVVALCQRMSLCPSLLKSPVPTAFHVVEQPESALQGQEIFSVPVTPPKPFSNQTETSPVVALCHSMSVLEYAVSVAESAIKKTAIEVYLFIVNIL
jgi:hypothetical protein